LFGNGRTVLSFEIFPPKMTVPVESIFNKLESFCALKPDFISVTYGAGGSQKDRTVEISSKIKNTYNVESVAHFTCIGHSTKEIDNMLKSLKANNIQNIVALRGDIPENAKDFDINKNVFKHASELIRYINSKDNFCITAAAYVEGHPDSKTLKEDLVHLKEKVDCGVDLLLTQLFFDNRILYDFIEKAENIGIKCPLSAGIMPIFKADQIKTIAAKSDCSIPAKLVLMMDKYQDNPEDLIKAGIEYASAQIQDLIDNKVDGIHLYTMNRPKSTKTILDNIKFLQNKL
jgi:methylenetetrahydrofolate reductase (NADPH)